MDQQSPNADEFEIALRESAPLYRIDLKDEEITHLRAYYELVMAWSPRLHLVAPCTPAKFATRHVLESLLAVAFMKEGAFVVDVGSGAGLPIVPCLIVRKDLTATLIESSQKKVVFLREAIRRLGLLERAKVCATRFELVSIPDATIITCRALDRFIELLPNLLDWSAHRKSMLLFGGDTLHEQLENLGLEYSTTRIPNSDRSYLFAVDAHQ